MQDNVDIYTKALIRVIQDSKEYREFCEVKRKLADMPELKRQIHEYRMEVYRLQNFGDEESLYDKMQEFNVQYSRFQRNPLVDEYLRNEIAVCRMIQKISTSIVEAVDLELDEVIQGLR